MPDNIPVANWLEPFLKNAGLSQEELGDRLGLSRATINRLANDHSKLKRQRAELVAEVLGATPDDLMLNRPPPPPRELTYEALPEHDASWRPQADFDGEAYSREEWKPKVPGALPEIDLRYGAGEGSVGEVMALKIGAEAYSGHKIIDEWPFPSSFLHSLGASPSQAIVGEVVGDSMLPNYLPGDRVIVDLAQNTMMADGVYVFTDGHSPPQIKRLQRRPFTDPPMVAIISDNPAYDPAEVELAQVRILGKVVWHLGRR